MARDGEESSVARSVPSERAAALGYAWEGIVLGRSERPVEVTPEAEVIRPVLPGDDVGGDRVGEEGDDAGEAVLVCVGRGREIQAEGCCALDAGDVGRGVEDVEEDVGIGARCSVDSIPNDLRRRKSEDDIRSIAEIWLFRRESTMQEVLEGVQASWEWREPSGLELVKVPGSEADL